MNFICCEHPLCLLLASNFELGNEVCCSKLALKSRGTPVGLVNYLRIEYLPRNLPCLDCIVVQGFPLIILILPLFAEN
jgi:hypothetical protein